MGLHGGRNGAGVFQRDQYESGMTAGLWLHLQSPPPRTSARTGSISSPSAAADLCRPFVDVEDCAELCLEQLLTTRPKNSRQRYRKKKKAKKTTRRSAEFLRGRGLCGRLSLLPAVNFPFLRI